MDLASLVSYFSSQRPRVSGSLIDAGPSARAYSRPKLILARLRPCDLGAEQTIVGKVERKVGFGLSRLSQFRFSVTSTTGAAQKSGVEGPARQETLILLRAWLNTAESQLQECLLKTAH